MADRWVERMPESLVPTRMAGEKNLIAAALPGRFMHRSAGINGCAIIDWYRASVS